MNFEYSRQWSSAGGVNCHTLYPAIYTESISNTEYIKLTLVYFIYTNAYTYSFTLVFTIVRFVRN